MQVFHWHGLASLLSNLSFQGGCIGLLQRLNWFTRKDRAAKRNDYYGKRDEVQAIEEQSRRYKHVKTSIEANLTHPAIVAKIPINTLNQIFKQASYGGEAGSILAAATVDPLLPFTFDPPPSEY